MVSRVMKALLLSLAVLLTAALAPASTAAAFRVNGFIGGPPGGTGGSFVDPTDVAVLGGSEPEGPAGAIFVTEGAAGNNRVQRLDPNGNFELAWGRDVVRAGARGDRGQGFEVCRHAQSCRTAPPGSRPGELRRPSGVATNPATGAVYVADGGNRRVQQFTVAGVPVRSWTIDVAGTTGDASLPMAIAVGPAAPHDVFVGDQSTNRVLQFTAAGRLLRIWGWGVAGGDGFEACDAIRACKAGRQVSGGGSATPRWPNHVAVDASGVLYASTFLGEEFDNDDLRTRIERFGTVPPPNGVDASGALLEPLEVDDGLAAAGEEESLLSNGATLGLDLSPTSGSLLAINNPFGTSKLDIVSNPGGALDSARPPRVAVVDDLPFLQNVTGMAVADRGALFLLSSGTLHPRFGRSTFTGCPRPDAPMDCHGLIALADGGLPDVVLTGPPGVGNAWIDPRGVARYRLQLSSDGRRWRAVGPSRLVAGADYERVRLPPLDVRGDRVHLARLVVTKRGEDGTRSVYSNVALGSGR